MNQRDRYGSDVLAGDWRAPSRGRAVEVEAESGQVVTQAWLDAGTWELDIAGRRHPALASIRPLYDPELKRVRA